MARIVVLRGRLVPFGDFLTVSAESVGPEQTLVSDRDCYMNSIRRRQRQLRVLVPWKCDVAVTLPAILQFAAEYTY